MYKVIVNGNIFFSCGLNYTVRNESNIEGKRPKSSIDST
jgi:hypothetical protein